MKSYKEYVLLEGVIEVDEDVVRFLTDFSVAYILNAMLTKWGKPLTSKTKSIIKKFSNSYLNNAIKLSEELSVLHFDITLENSYVNVEYNVKKYNINSILHYVIDIYEDQYSKGGYIPYKDAIIVNMNNVDIVLMINDMLESINNDTFKEKQIVDLEDDLYTTIKHEVIHAIREKLSKDKGIASPKLKSGYDKDFSHYVTSDVEVESWISNDIEKFKSAIKQIKYDIKMTKYDTKQLMKYWLGDRDKQSESVFKKYEQYLGNHFDNDFYGHMKKLEPKRYRNVIAKTYIELEDYINRLFNSNSK